MTNAEQKALENILEYVDRSAHTEHLINSAKLLKKLLVDSMCTFIAQIYQQIKDDVIKVTFDHGDFVITLNARHFTALTNNEQLNSTLKTIIHSNIHDFKRRIEKLEKLLAQLEEKT